MNMKTWTNPSVEELEVELTASLDHPWYHENNNGYWDGNKYWGSENGSENGNENGDENGDETSGPNS